MTNYVWKSRVWGMTGRMDFEGQRVEMELVNQIVKDLNLDETNRDKGDKRLITNHFYKWKKYHDSVTGEEIDAFDYDGDAFITIEFKDIIEEYKLFNVINKLLNKKFSHFLREQKLKRLI